MTSPLPVTIIAGYLGAGKTTQINHLLAATHDRNIVVMVNDFGDIAIDADLISARDADTITLTNGCVCCSIGADLFTAFTKVLNRTPRPDHLVIEASGVAEPHRIADLARAEPDLALDAIITLADCRNVLEQTCNPLIAKTLNNQFAAASLIALSKIDLASTGERRELQILLSTVNPHAPQLACPLAPEILLSPAQTVPVSPPDESPDHEHAYSRWSLNDAEALSLQQLQHIIDNPPAGVLRLKGLNHDALTGQTNEFHIAGAQSSLTTRPAQPIAKSGLSAVAIGLSGKLDTAALDRLFKSKITNLELHS